MTHGDIGGTAVVYQMGNYVNPINGKNNQSIRFESSSVEFGKYIDFCIVDEPWSTPEYPIPVIQTRINEIIPLKSWLQY